MHYRALAMVTIGLLCLLGAIWVVAAQDAVECATTLETFFTAASDACISGPLGYICNGGGAPGVEPGGQIASALASVGSLVEAGVVDAIRTPPFVGGSGGIAWLRHNAPLQYTAFLVGDAAVRDVTPPDFPAWQSVVVQT